MSRAGCSRLDLQLSSALKLVGGDVWPTRSFIALSRAASAIAEEQAGAARILSQHPVLCALLRAMHDCKLDS